MRKSPLMLKALERTISKTPKFKPVFEIQQIIRIVQECDNWPYSQVYKTLYVMAYFGFLRISNMVPVSWKMFLLKAFVQR